jgi:hypothetical protein
MASETITQIKGQLSVIWGATSIFNLSKDASVSYDIGQNGNTMSSMRDIVHVLEDASSIVSTITINIPKGASEIALLDAQMLTQTPYPLLVRDNGIGMTVAMASAICTQVAMSDSTGASDLELITYSFQGNVFRAAL